MQSAQFPHAGRPRRLSRHLAIGQMPKLLAALAMALVLLLSPPLAAAPAGPPTGLQVELGAGVIGNPEFVGSRDYQLTPIPYVDLRWLDEQGTLLFASVPRGIGGYLVRHRPEGGLRFDVAAAVAPGFATRDDEIPGLQPVDISTEARLYLEAGSQAWNASLTLAQDLGTGHEGAYAELGLAFRNRIGKRGFYSVGPVLRVGDADFVDAQYAVSAAESPRAGLPRFEPDAGVESIGLQGLVSLPVSEHWRWTAIVRGGRILGDRADSPIVETPTQFFFLTAFTRAF